MLTATKEYKDKIYAPVRRTNARLKFTMDGVTKTYFDNKIIEINILEEMDTLSTTIPSNELKVTIDNTDGDFNFLNLSNIKEVLAKKPTIEVEIGVEITHFFSWNNFNWAKFTFAGRDQETFEYILMGKYSLVEWKSPKGSMTVSLIGRDNFDALSQISYSRNVANNLKALAEDVLSQAGITSYEIDTSLATIPTTGFPERLDSRTALQHIAVASRSAIYQDRYGKIILRPFRILDQSSNYIIFCGQAGLYASTATYPETMDDYSMKIIERSNIFSEPDIKLEKSIYEVVIEVYGGEEKEEKIYINQAASKNGVSYKIDNPLIQSEEQAESVVSWIIAENKRNVSYRTTWRQNLILECGDMVLVQDAFDAKKQSRIIKNEFEYRGYLRGNTDSKGGL